MPEKNLVNDVTKAVENLNKAVKAATESGVSVALNQKTDFALKAKGGKACPIITAAITED